MPRPARHDQLPRLTSLIDWESLGSLIDGTGAELLSTVEDRSLPILGTDSLPLPHGLLDANVRGRSQEPYQAHNWVGPLSNPAHEALDFFQIQYMETLSDTFVPQGQSNDLEQSMSGRLQQCQNALQSLGFPSVDAFALEYYTAQLGCSPQVSVAEQREHRGQLDCLIKLLQNTLPRGKGINEGGLHRNMAQCARALYIEELRDFDHTLYDPDKAEHQLPQIYHLLHDMLIEVGCRPDLADATARSSIQGLLSSKLL